MNADEYWEMFTETGNIIFYLLYRAEINDEKRDETTVG